jgi:hypothetical protein
MHQELYADGIGEVTVSGTIVRIDLVSLSPSERDHANSPKPVFRQRVIMPVEAFANSVELMQKVLQGLIDAGAVKKTPVAPAEAEKHGRGANGSPNFS